MGSCFVLFVKDFIKIEHKKLCQVKFWSVTYCATKERFLIVFETKWEEEENKSRQFGFLSAARS